MRERTNAQWLAELRGPNPNEALADLYDLLVRGLRAALGGRAGANIEDFAQEALLKITNNLDSFRGESHFTTWAKKIAMNVALTELNRRRWREAYGHQSERSLQAAARRPQEAEAAHGGRGTPSTGGAGNLRRRVRPRASSESRTSEVEQEICNVGSR